jgi:RHS repeat-associated protein
VVDGLGRRVAKKVDGQVRFGLLYGEAMGPSAQLDPDGSIRNRFVYGTRSTVPDYMLRDGHRFRIVSDDLGSPRLVVDLDSGEVAQRLDYDAFGRVVQDTNPGFQPFGFAGGLYDADTGLVRFGARDYDPETGRWTAQDPIDFAAGDSNLYGYVLGDPVNLVDPSGLYVETGVDVAFVVYDITTLALGCGSWGSLALDTGGIFLPFVAGLGHADKLPAGRLLFDSWHEATFPNKTQSVTYHWDKHARALGKSPTQYTRDALDFFRQNRGIAEQVTLKDGSAGLRINIKGGPGGYFTPDGRVVTFWYR